MRVVGMKRCWIEDEGYSSVLLDCLGKVGSRGSPVLGKLEEVTSAKGALPLVVVDGGNQTSLLSWGEVVGFHSLMRLTIVFPLLLLFGLRTLFNLLELFLFLLPVLPTPTLLLHTPQTKFQPPSHFLLLFPRIRCGRNRDIHAIILAVCI